MFLPMEAPRPGLEPSRKPTFAATTMLQGVERELTGAWGSLVRGSVERRYQGVGLGKEGNFPG